MKVLEKKILKKRLLLLAIVFLTGACLVIFMMVRAWRTNQAQVRENARMNAMTYAERMIEELSRGTSVTDTLKELVVSENGKVDGFEMVAEDLMTHFIQSIQLAPDGVVTDIYPAEGNEVGKIDLIHDEKRGQIACYGRDNKVTVMQGPFSLNQGGMGIAVRNPVYLKNENGETAFWGFTIVIIRIPEIFKNSVQALTGFDYDYCLSKTATPFTDSYDEIDSSGKKLENPVEYKFEIGECSWKLEVMPSNGWSDAGHMMELLISGCVIVLLLNGLTAALLIVDANRRKLKKMSATDGLTGLLNRQGLNEEVDTWMRKYPDHSCVCITLDIDDFKFINDVYGHLVGDMVLQKLADSMREIIQTNAVMGRNGGDEFSVLLKDTTIAQSEALIRKFAATGRTFEVNGQDKVFGISVGYAEYPLQASDKAQLLWNADAALYEVKLHGKQGCQSYSGHLKLEKRSQLGFALKDISENLPGSFLIYKEEDSRILFANKEMIRYAGCTDLDDFFEFTAQDFFHLVREEERENIAQSIRKQIMEDKEEHNDYVQFHMQCKDGTEHRVLDYGRLVENRYYGKIFYVLIMDEKAIKKYYHLQGN